MMIPFIFSGFLPRQFYAPKCHFSPGGNVSRLWSQLATDENHINNAQGHRDRTHAYLKRHTDRHRTPAKHYHRRLGSLAFFRRFPTAAILHFLFPFFSLHKSFAVYLLLINQYFNCPCTTGRWTWSEGVWGGPGCLFRSGVGE